jgi:uncharacterized RDD family membrane protein YckC
MDIEDHSAEGALVPVGVAPTDGSILLVRVEEGAFVTNPYGPPSGPQSFGQPSGGFPQQPGQPVPQYGAPAGGAYPPGYHPVGELAPWGTRVLGYLIDVGVPGAIASVLAIVLLAVAFGSISTGSDSGAVIAGIAFLVVCVVLPLAGAALQIWNSAYRRGTTGQTFGQKMVKIKTVSEETGQPIGFGNAFLRDLCHGLDGLACGVGYLAPLWDEKRQTWADKIVRTVVVRVDSQPGSFQSGHPQQPGFPQPPGYGQ